MTDPECMYSVYTLGKTYQHIPTDSEVKSEYKIL